MIQSFYVSCPDRFLLLVFYHVSQRGHLLEVKFFVVLCPIKIYYFTTYLVIHYTGSKTLYAGVKLQGDWGEIVALEGSKSPWEAQRATKTSPSVFVTFEKASTCAK